MNVRWLMMARRWVQNPPSPAKIKFMATIIAICVILFAFEYFLGWPEALTPNRMRP